jgi:hypothetical protein
MSKISPELAPYYVKPSAAFQLPHVRKPGGRCYELAGKFALDNPGAVVVHGVVHGWMAHAWAEIDGLVYDGPAGGLFPMPDYYRVTEAVPVRRFELVAEVADWILGKGTWGPCDELNQYLAEHPGRPSPDSGPT